jgi:hypothetical protein
VQGDGKREFYDSDGFALDREGPLCYNLNEKVYINRTLWTKEEQR